jgi:hypothetical protein
MISNPKDGFCDFIIDDFHRRPSYLTDVPMDLLNAFIDYFCNRRVNACIPFDEDGKYFNLVLTPYSSYIIVEDETPSLITLSLSPTELAGDLIADLEDDIDKWVDEFGLDYEQSDNKDKEKEIFDKRKNEMLRKINSLKYFFECEDEFGSDEPFNIMKDKSEKEEDAQGAYYKLLLENVVVNN